MTMLNGWILPDPQPNQERLERLPELLEDIHGARSIDEMWPSLQRLISRHAWCDLPDEEAQDRLIGDASRHHQAQSLVTSWMQRCVSGELTIRHRCARNCRAGRRQAVAR